MLSGQIRSREGNKLAGFRKGRSTIEQTFVLRNIVEQVVKRNSTVNLCFVYHVKTFESIHRDTLWKITRCFEIPPMIVRMVQVMYTNCTSAVVNGDDWLEVKSGVKQGCNMLVFLLRMANIERKYCLISTSCLTGLFDISILCHI